MNDGILFENDVKMYGTQAVPLKSCPFTLFENDVKMYGTQARRMMKPGGYEFENDVKMYGTQAGVESGGQVYGLRMM